MLSPGVRHCDDLKHNIHDCISEIQLDSEHNKNLKKNYAVHQIVLYFLVMMSVYIDNFSILL